VQEVQSGVQQFQGLLTQVQSGISTIAPIITQVQSSFRSSLAERAQASLAQPTENQPEASGNDVEDQFVQEVQSGVQQLQGLLTQVQGGISTIASMIERIQASSR
jgi:uncharacterized phage infection (PIP) family protein YhgE